jgi:hypothetical protein
MPFNEDDVLVMPGLWHVILGGCFHSAGAPNGLWAGTGLHGLHEGF